MVDRGGAIAHAHLHSAGKTHLVGMHLRNHTVPGSGLEDTGGILHSEESLLYENIHVVCQSLGGDGRHDLTDYLFHIPLPVAFITGRHGVGPEEGGADPERSLLLHPAGDPEHLDLILDGEAVTALDLHRTGAQGDYLMRTDQGLLQEVILRGIVQQLHRIEDTAAPAGNLLIGKAAQLVHELHLAAAGIDQMGVGVAVGREHHPALSVNHLIRRAFQRFQFLRLQVLHPAEAGDTVFLRQQPGTVKTGQRQHLLSPQRGRGSRFPHIDKFFYIFYKN